ncbi:MAG: haloalkane dehalogenase [Actinobacteria bacterium]|nr:haloalkane dehalogenase [Actinomycetota bacterium]
MKILRTPDERFAGLPDWPWSPNYTFVNAHSSTDSTKLRLHHIDTGSNRTGETVLCMHGEPSWSFLYRKMIGKFVDAGHRVVAPDLVGFGRSDKPAETSDYSYEKHVDWMSQWLVANDLGNLTLVCQDWGGLIGLRLVAAMPERFARVVAANTFLNTGDRPPSDAFMAWRKYSQETPVFNVGAIVQGGCKIKPLADEVRRAYDAPFPDESFKSGARVFPTLVPISPDDPSAVANVEAWKSLRKFDKPFLTAFSDSDPVTAGGDKYFQREIAGCAGQAHTTIANAAHFLQEDAGEEFAAVVNRFIGAQAVKP